MSILQIANALDSGEVIAYPTEAVWGLGCDYRNPQAVNKLLHLKKRATAQGLILICSGFAEAASLLESLPEKLKKQLPQYWPGFTTLLLPDVNNQVPEWIKGEHQTFALRISRHPAIRQINQAWPYPIVSTSANIHGDQPATCAEQIAEVFGGQVQIIDGELGGAKEPSRIMDLVTGKYLR